MMLLLEKNHVGDILEKNIKRMKMRQSVMMKNLPMLLTKGAIMPDLSVFKNVESQAAADAYVEEIKASSACSCWLKAALEEALKRDPVDAVKDAEGRSMILQVRAAANLHEMTRKA